MNSAMPEENPPMSDRDAALICAYRAATDGQLKTTDWGGVDAWRPEDGLIWVHMDRKAPGSRQWLTESSGLPPLVVDALLQEETRPRFTPAGEGCVVILRGVNLNPGAQPEAMVSMRMWVDAQRLISLRGPRVLAIQDLRDTIDAGQGPRTTGQLLVDVAERMISRMGPVITDLEEALDEVEEQLLGKAGRELRTRLITLRREGIILRRYIAPQRDVLARLAAERIAWLDDTDRARLREVTDRVTRYVEDLEAIRDRAAVAQEELANRLSDQMNRTMYMLSLVATVFLPLGFITGLLGINVGGIPGEGNPSAFYIVSAGLAALAVVQAGFFWMRRLL
jgi:zinc transporter